MADEQVNEQVPEQAPPVPNENENGAVRRPGQDNRQPPPLPQQPEEEPQNLSRFAGANQSIELLRRHMGRDELDSYFDEMVRTGGRVRQDRDGIIVDLPNGAHIHSHVKGGHEVIEPEGGKVDAQSAKAMIALAKTRGWGEIEVTGKPDEQALLWMEAQRQGLKVVNFEPPQALKEAWEREQAIRAQQQPQGSVTPANSTPTNVDTPQAATIEEIDDTVYRQTLKTLQDRAGAEQNPAVKKIIEAVADGFTDAVAQGDKRSYSVIAQGLAEKDQLAGMNKVIDFLNRENPGLNLHHIEDGAPQTSNVAPQRTGPKAIAPG